MTTISKALLASLGLLAAAPLAAQPADLDPQTVSAAARYALPLAFDGFLTTCSAELDENGYALSNEGRLTAKFSDGVDAAWPQAKTALMQLGGDQGDGMSDLIGMLDDEQLRPFVDGIIETMVAGEIKVKDCANIERGLEILDPLPADNVAELVGFLFEMGVDGRTEQTTTITGQ